MTSTLKPIMDAPYRILRADTVVHTLVGVDAENEVKIYDSVAKTDAKPPYVVIQMIPVLGDDTGVYGDIDVIKVIYFQTTSWARNRNESLQLADAVNEALQIGDWVVDPWELMHVKLDGMPQLLGDRDTDLMQTQCRYRAMFGR